MTFDSTRVSAHDVPDLYNTLPVVLGFRPEDSLVVIATHGERRSFGLTIRLDLPPIDKVDAAAEVVVGHLRHHAADGAIVLALTERQDVAKPLIRAVEQRLGDIEPVAVARSDGQRYWVDGLPWFPADGIAYATSDHHLAIVQAVAAGCEVLPDRAALVRRFEPAEGPARVQVDRQLVACRARVLGSVARDDRAVGRAMADLEPILLRVEVGRPLGHRDVALLGLWLQDLRVRDEVWARIERSNARAYLDALAHATRLVDEPFVPAVATLAGFAAWLTGDGAQAMIATDRALTVRPGYSFADLIQQVVGAGTSPTFWDEARSRLFGADRADGAGGDVVRIRPTG